jgi:hypothetical protein
LSSGDTTARPSIHKFAQPIKIACSWLSDEVRGDYFGTIEAESEMRAADTPVLREADSTVRRELARLDLTDRGFNQMTIFAPLLVRD